MPCKSFLLLISLRQKKYMMKGNENFRVNSIALSEKASLINNARQEMVMRTENTPI